LSRDGPEPFPTGTRTLISSARAECAYPFGETRRALFFIREQLAAGAHPFDKYRSQARPRCIKTGRQSSRPAADNDRIVNLAVCHKLEKTLSEGSAHAYRERKEGI